jgi:hypothetical protein
MSTSYTTGEGDKSKMSAIVVGVLIAVIPAVLGYAVSFANNVKASQLALVNRQLEKLYGPLYAVTQANDATWTQFSLTHWPNHRRYYFDPAAPPTIEQVKTWRIWIRNVFQPMNLQMEHAIVGNSQLGLGNDMPRVFQKLIAQTEAYKAIIATWKDSDDTRPDFASPNANTVAGLNYPTGIIGCVSDSFKALKDRQEFLQGAFMRVLWLSPVPSPKSCDIAE